MGVFSGCLFACDIDGTLLINGIINPRNIEKIEYFVSEGGCFSLSTGRTVGAVGPVLEKIKHISPSIVSNGSMIYDYENKRVLNELFIDKSDYYIVKKVMDMGLDVGIEVHSGDRVLTLCRTAETDIHQKYEWLESTDISFARFFPSILWTSSPSTVTFPLIGFINPEAISNNVDFPQPFAPTIEIISPVFISAFISNKTCFLP